MKRLIRPRRCVLVGFSAVVICLAAILTPNVSRGKVMNAEALFSGKQLAAYKLAQRGDVEGVLQVAKQGLDLNQPGSDDMTLLGFAVLTSDRKAIVSLMHAGADPNRVIPGAGSPAILAITKHFNPPDTAAINALLEGGYDPNQLLDHGKPYLFFFVDYNHWLGLKLALERGGNFDIQRSNGKALLTYLIDNGDYLQARELIAMGANVAVRGQRGETALRSIEFKVTEVEPSICKVWKEVVAMRELILSKLPDPEDRRSAFTDEAEEKIRNNP